jgi:hypothetical protein
MILKHKVVLIAFVGLLSQSIFAQWTHEKGKGYYKLSAWYLEADEHYTSDGGRAPNATRTQFNTNIYAEYGITDKFDIIAFVPFFARTTQNDEISGTTRELITPGQAVNSIGDIDLSVRYGILKGKNYAWTTSILLGLPTGKSSGGSDGSFQTGDGEFNQYIRTDFGISFGIGNLANYAKAYVGLNNRTEGFSDEFRIGAEIGSNIIDKKLWLIGRADILQSLQNGDSSIQLSQGSVFASNIEFTSLGAEVAYYFTKKIGVSLGFATAVSGSLVFAAPSFTGGVFLDIK